MLCKTVWSDDGTIVLKHVTAVVLNYYIKVCISIVFYLTEMTRRMLTERQRNVETPRHYTE
jgi:hypothetical protein